MDEELLHVLKYLPEKVSRAGGAFALGMKGW